MFIIILERLAGLGLTLTFPVCAPLLRRDHFSSGDVKTKPGTINPLSLRSHISPGQDSHKGPTSKPIQVSFTFFEDWKYFY